MPLYKNETTTDLADLISKLNTFLTTGGGGNPGWTADRHVPASGEWAISKNDGGSNDVEVAFQWDTATPDNLGIYQYRSGSGAGNYNTGVAPYAQANDSGNGAASTSNATLETARYVEITNTPTQYWCFTGDTYAHIVIELSGGADYRHFGFGVLDKINDWTGGEYCYGWKFLSSPTTDVAIQARSTMLLDGLCAGTSPDAMQNFCATMHIEGMTDTPTSGLWGVFMGNQGSANLGNDRQSTPRGRIHLTHGFRNGIWAKGFGDFIGTQNMGYVPTYPITITHWDRDISGSSSQADSLSPPLGSMKDVRGVSLENFSAKETVTISGDTWHIFPSAKRYSGTLQGTTGYQGIMYKEN